MNKKSWKSTTMGVLGLLFLGLNLYNDPKAIQDATGQAAVAGQVLTCIGMIGLDETKAEQDKKKEEQK